MLLQKYTKAEHGLSYLTEGYLRFSPLPELNDPFEMNPFIDSLGTPEQETAITREMEEEFEEFRHLSLDEKQHILHRIRATGPSEMQARMVNEFSTIGILCLVKENRRDLLMWAHYADSHRGCVLEFDGSHPWFMKKHGTNPHELLGGLHKVNYSPNRPHVSLLGMGKADLLTKAKCWEYEREWRIILNLYDCTTRCRNGKEVVGFFPVPLQALTNVFLGVNTDPQVRDQFLSILPKGHPTGLFQFRLDVKDFNLVARQLN